MNARAGVIAALALFLCLSAVSGQSARTALRVDEGWRLAPGDDPARAGLGFDDSGWAPASLPWTVSLDGAGQYFWLRAVVEVPPELRGASLWFETGKAACAMEVYVDGVFIGGRGRLPPDYFARAQQNTALLIPAPLAEDGRLVIALRCYYNGSQSFLPGFALGNAGHAEFVNHVQNLFNMRVYVILAFICLFLGSYFISQFALRPDDKASLYFALSLIFIAVYFFDMGSERLFMEGLAQRALGRISLSASLGFLLLFLVKFFGSRGYTAAKIAVALDITIFSALFIVNMRDDSAINAIFNLSLLPVFSVIIIGLVIVVKAVRRRRPDSWPILIGLAVGVGFGVHDIVYQVAGMDPFAWLQGFTFFSLNLSVFVAMSGRAARAQKELDRTTKETAAQRDRLGALVSSAERLAADASAIARELDAAVSSVAEAAASSAGEAVLIVESAGEQGRSLAEANGAVGGLVSSIKAVNAELEGEARSLELAAAQTAELLAGFEAVGEGLEGAASFAEALDGMTRKGRADMELLSGAMAKVKASSAEILGVVDAVNDFADRTNLLAMNASIEAAHAGAAGKGFAVIAQEIKKLAAASAERAAKIGQIASGIRGAVDEGFELSVRVKGSLEALADDAGATSGRVLEAARGMGLQREAGGRIAAESEALASSAGRVRAEAGRQASYSERVAASMAELSGAAERVGRAAGGIADKNRRLAAESEALKGLAGRARRAAEEMAALMNA